MDAKTRRRIRTWRSTPTLQYHGVASILRTGVQLDFCPETKDLSRRDYRTQPGVLTPGTDIKDVRPEIGGREVSALDAERDPQPIFCRPFSIPNPLRGCNSDLAQNSNTPLDPNPTFRARARARGRFLIRLMGAGRLLN